LIDGRSPLEVIATRAGLDLKYAGLIVHTLNAMGLIEPVPRAVKSTNTGDARSDKSWRGM
jgi:hypothetical protein